MICRRFSFRSPGLALQRVSHVSVACTSKPYIYPLHVQLACVRQSILTSIRYMCNWPACDRACRRRRWTRECHMYPLHVQVSLTSIRYMCNWPACDRACCRRRWTHTMTTETSSSLRCSCCRACTQGRTHARTHTHTHTHTHTARTQVQKLYSDSFHVDELTELREEYLAMRENDSSMLSLSQVMHAHIHEIIQARGPHVPPCACVSDACV